MCTHHNHAFCKYFEDRSPVRLDELHYRDLMGDIVPNNTPGQKTTKLPFRDWAPLIPSVKYVTTRGNTMKFFVPNKYNGWETYIQFPQWFEQVNDESLTAPEAARLLLWSGDVKLHCHCPSFTFWGFNYILDQMDASIYHEDRYPNIRNPNLKGIACKHLIRTLKVLPFHLADMAGVIKAQRLRGADVEIKPQFDIPAIPVAEPQVA